MDITTQNKIKKKNTKGATEKTREIQTKITEIRAQNRTENWHRKKGKKFTGNKKEKHW